MPHANWFFGFPIAGDFLVKLPEPPAFFRRFHPDDVHVTLAFLGNSGEEAAKSALAALDARLASAPCKPIEISLGEVVPMGPPRRYSALSAVLARGRAEVIECIASLRDILADAAKARRDQRPPKPHVTIARPKNRADNAARRAGLAWAAALDLRAVHARLDRIALYTWSETRQAEQFRIFDERSLGSTDPEAQSAQHAHLVCK